MLVVYLSWIGTLAAGAASWLVACEVLRAIAVSTDAGTEAVAIALGVFAITASLARWATAHRVARTGRPAAWLAGLMFLAAVAVPVAPWIAASCRRIFPGWAGIAFAAWVASCVPAIALGCQLPLLLRASDRRLREHPAGPAASIALHALAGLAFAFLTWRGLVRAVGAGRALWVSDASALLAAAFWWAMDRWALRPAEPEVVAVAAEAPARRRKKKRDAPAVPDSPGSIVPDPRTLAVYAFISAFGLAVHAAAVARFEMLVVGMNVPALGAALVPGLVALGLGYALGGGIGWATAPGLVPLALLEVLLGFAQLIGIVFTGALPQFYTFLRLNFHVPAFAFEILLHIGGASVGALPALLFGAIASIAVRLAQVRGGSATVAASLIHGAVLLGAGLGACLGLLVVIPGLGHGLAVECGAVLNLAMGLALWHKHPALDAPREILPVTVVGTLALAYIVLAPGIDLGASLGEAHRLSFAGRPADGPAAGVLRSRHRPLFFRAEPGTVVAVDEWPDAGLLTLRINDQVVSNAGPDRSAETLVAHAPLLLARNEPKRALLIGFGPGIAARSALTHPLERLDCVESSTAVLESSLHFIKENGGCLADPRLTLGQSAETYDVIVLRTGEHAWPLVATPVTRDELDRLGTRLGPDGVLSCLMKIDALTSASLALTLRTVCSVFPHVTVLSVQPASLVVLASRGPIDVDDRRLAARFDRPGVKQDLAGIGIRHPLTFLGYQLVAEQNALEVVGSGSVNSVSWPLRDFALRREATGEAPADEPLRSTRLASRQGWVLERLARRGFDVEEVLEFCETLQLEYPVPVLVALLKEAAEKHPADARVYALIARLLGASGDPSGALAAVARAIVLEPGNVRHQELRYQVAVTLEGNQPYFSSPSRYPIALDAAQACIRMEPDNFDHYRKIAAVHYDRQEWKECALAYEKAIEVAQHSKEAVPPTLIYDRIVVAECWLKLGDPTKAQQVLTELERHPPPTQPEQRERYMLVLKELERVQSGARGTPSR